MSAAELAVAHDRLDKAGSQYAKGCRRAHPRLDYRRSSIAVQVVHRGGSMTPTTMASRNLSAGGICLLSPGFVHVGTTLQVVLRKSLGGEVTVTGQVLSCRHAAGVLHAIAVKFDQPIFVKHFLEPRECQDLLATTQADPAQLRGKVLLLDDGPADRALFAFHMKKTKCEVATCATLAEAGEAMAKLSPDVVVCDLNLGGETGETAIASFRKLGFRGHLVALTAETDQNRLKAALAAGANEVFAKPYDGPKLYAQMAGWLKAAGAGEPSLVSTLADGSDADEMIDQYVKQVGADAGQLADAIASDDFQRVRLIVQSFMGTGIGYGFAPLSEAGRDALTALDASQSVEESATELKLLQSMARRLAVRA